MGKNYKNLAVVVLIVILNGCFQPQLNYNQQQLKKRGFDPFYSKACGPTAISHCLKKFNINIAPEDAAKEIQKNDPLSDLSRNIIFVFNYEGSKITWPNEIKEELKRRGFSTIEFIGDQEYLKLIMDDASKYNEQGIALCKDKDDSLAYHYKEFPPTCDVMSSYSNTEIIKVYLILPK